MAIMVNPPPETNTPRPSLISVWRWTTQQDTTDNILRMGEKGAKIRRDSQNSKASSRSRSKQKKVRIVWKGSSPLVHLRKSMNQNSHISIILTMFQDVHLLFQLESQAFLKTIYLFIFNFNSLLRKFIDGITRAKASNRNSFRANQIYSD